MFFTCEAFWKRQETPIAIIRLRSELFNRESNAFSIYRNMALTQYTEEATKQHLGAIYFGLRS